MWFLHWAYQALNWLEADYRAKPCDEKWGRNGKVKCKITENSLHIPVIPMYWVDCGLWIKTLQTLFPCSNRWIEGWKGEWICVKMKGKKTGWKRGVKCERETNRVPSSIFFPCVFDLMGHHLLIKLVYCADLWMMALHGWVFLVFTRRKWGCEKPQSKMKGRNQKNTDKSEGNCANFKRFALVSCVVEKLEDEKWSKGGLLMSESLIQ